MFLKMFQHTFRDAKFADKYARAEFFGTGVSLFVASVAAPFTWMASNAALEFGTDQAASNVLAACGEGV
jgi:hypothetical protein